MDISTTTAPKSDQMNHDDVVAGPLTVTVKEVFIPGGDQPVEIHTHEFPGRPFKPAKTVRRVLQAAWGKETDNYAGRRMVLVSDPTVKFGGAVVGGIRISHLSHIDKPITLALTATRGKKGHHTINPLVEAEPTAEPWQAQWQAITNALTAAGYEGDGPAMLATAGQVIGAEWTHPNQISAEAAQKVLAAVREEPNNDEEN